MRGRDWSARRTHNQDFPTGHWLACVAGGFVGVLNGGAAKTSGEAARGMGRRNCHSRCHSGFGPPADLDPPVQIR